MRSDRRTMAVLGVVIICTILAAPFRSSVLMGFRLLLGQATLANSTVVSTTDQSDAINLGAWTLPEPNGYSGTERNEQLGQVVVDMFSNWNQEVDAGREAIAPLEKYVNDHPEDVKACAHLLRVSLSVSDLSKVRDKKVLSDQAERMAVLANKASRKEPDNWYWREREFHFLMLMGQGEKAERMFTQMPFPTVYQDYVDDEVNCKEALYRASYWDFPDGLTLPIWAGTIYPHYASIFAIDRQVRESHDPVKLRVAEVKLGMDMMHASPNLISAFVGVRALRSGLWMVKKPSSDWKKQMSVPEENTIKDAFVDTVGESEWNHALKLAREEVTLHFLMEEQNPRDLYYTQFGPILTAAGILVVLMTVPMTLLGRSKKIMAIQNPWVSWVVLFAALLLSAASWNRWSYMINYSLGSKYLDVPFMLASVWAFIATIRREKGRERFVGAIVIALGFAIGMITPQMMAASSLWLILYVVQRGRQPLSPWPAALGIALLSFQAMENMAFWRGDIMVPIGFLIGLIGILAALQRSLEPDQPRWSGISIGLGLVVLGSFAMVQYNRGVVSLQQRELQRTQDIRKSFAEM